MEEDEEETWKKPLKIILALFLALIVIFMIIPSYKIKIDPEPEYIPTIDEVFFETSFDNETYLLKSKADFVNFVRPEDPILRRVSAKVISLSGCDSSRICQAKALYYFVRDNINYVSDPVDFEYVEDPKEVLYTTGADCESGTLLLATLYESIGLDSELVFIPKHAFLRVSVEDSPKRYVQDGWIYVDWTCKTCEFGKIPIKDQVSEKSFLDV